MKRTSTQWLAVLGVAALVLALPAAASAGSANANGLGQDLDTLLANAELAGGQAGLVVRDADTGATLYSREPDALLLPASNEKLVTSAAALDLLGPSYAFNTTVSTSGTRSGTTLNGDLVLKGYGDPSILPSDYTALAAKVAASGVKSVTGKLIADDTYFDSTRLGPGWAWDDEPYFYDAQVSALTESPDTSYDAGSVNVTVTPGQQGQPPTVTMNPPNTYLTVVNTATTGASGSAMTETVNRVHGANTITVSGSIPAGSAADTERMSVDNPTAFVAALFRKALSDNGVAVSGGTAYQAGPSGATTVATHTSPPLSQLQVTLLKQSDNMIAEAVTKAAGQQRLSQGSFAAGVDALTTKLSALGIDPNAYNQVDGSGLSRMNLVTAGQLAQLLVKAKSRSWFQSWYNALPVAGNSDPNVGGTLAGRMTGTAAANNVHAKTGSETGVSALSGYVTAANGEHLVFALVENDFLAASVKDVEDKVAERLAGYTGSADTAHVQQQRPTHVQEARPANPRAALECSWTHSC